MFGSVKLKNIRLTVFSLVCLMLFVAVCFLALRAGAPDTVTINGDGYSLRAEDDEDIAAFLSVCGYEPEELISDNAITVPKNWNEAYIGYNELQREQGFDLTPYKGKPAHERVYTVDGRYITLLIGDSKIIGGHVCDADGKNMKRLIE